MLVHQSMLEAVSADRVARAHARAQQRRVRRSLTPPIRARTAGALYRLADHLEGTAVRREQDGAASAEPAVSARADLTRAA